MKIENAKFDDYRYSLCDKYRPPSKGGNTKALHWHFIIINNITYSFKAPGTKQWVFKNDTVSFEYENKGEHKNIILETLKTMNKKGEIVIRGNRFEIQKKRTADTRPPTSSKEIRR